PAQPELGLEAGRQLDLGYGELVGRRRHGVRRHRRHFVRDVVLGTAFGPERLLRGRLGSRGRVLLLVLGVGELDCEQEDGGGRQRGYIFLHVGTSSDRRRKLHPRTSRRNAAAQREVRRRQPGFFTRKSCI